MPSPDEPTSCRLGAAVSLSVDKVHNPAALPLLARLDANATVLVVLAAGKGTRFGPAPKCIQPVLGLPLARHSMAAFRRLRPAPILCVVGYQHEAVATALGDQIVFIRSENPTGGTAWAAFEAFCVPELRAANPLLIVSMGDRVVPDSTFRRLLETHQSGGPEADLTFLSARYAPPANEGKGRVVRGPEQRVQQILEQRDIDAEPDPEVRTRWQNLTEGNCPLYAIRAATLYRHLECLTNANAQGQYYLTDIVEFLSRAAGEIRTITTSPGDPEYEVLCADVTRPADLGRLEAALRRLTVTPNALDPTSEAAAAAELIANGRPIGQTASIGRQLDELLLMAEWENLGFRPDQPVAIGVSGGRLRLAFMHPDMGRFFGPAWQMPLGAGEVAGEEQIVMLAQAADDQRIRLFPFHRQYRERTDHVPADLAVLYPGDAVSDWHSYEPFGTQMSEELLRLLGYADDEDLQRRRDRGEPLPPPALWVSTNLRRPFPLVANALASLRTVRDGEPGSRAQARLGRPGFHGLRMMSTGRIPEGGFASSSAVTVATMNALNALYDLGLPGERLVDLACQAEYGTGVRAGSLDQATAQLGRAGEGALISSNPRDHYRVLGTYPVPTDRFQILFPYTVPRDRTAWEWSWGFYAETPAPGRLTTGEVRKMTGKAAEIAALLTRLPLATDLFTLVQDDLLRDGELSRDRRAWIASFLRQLPLRVSSADLQADLGASRAWLIDQLRDTHQLDMAAARSRAESLLASLITGWRDPVLRRTTVDGAIVQETGLPLRALVAYLFGEVAKNFRLIRHPDQWIECVTWSQRGDRCVDLDGARLPERAVMETTQSWEAGVTGAALLERWLERLGATPFDYNRGLDDASLSAETPPQFDRLAGSNFFRGLALIDLAEAMLKRAFGDAAVAVRVNAAGQGDYFQVHVDRQRAEVEEVKSFIRQAFYRRFGFAPQPEFVEAHPGGPAVGVRLHRYDALPDLARRLRPKAKTP